MEEAVLQSVCPGLETSQSPPEVGSNELHLHR